MVLGSVYKPRDERRIGTNISIPYHSQLTATAANLAMASILISAPTLPPPFGASVDVGVGLPAATPERPVAVSSVVLDPSEVNPVGAGPAAVSASA